MKFARLPKHIGIIPDGNRRWAASMGLAVKEGYRNGIEPAKCAFRDFFDLGIEEVTVYIFTQENTRRPKEQVVAFRDAFIDFLGWMGDKDYSLLVVGDSRSAVFPKEALGLTNPQEDRQSRRRLNFLVNYSWRWDLSVAMQKEIGKVVKRRSMLENMGSSAISMIDLVIRWGGRNRLSGFLPVQSAYADIFVVKDMWPDYRTEHLHDALRWYADQDVTMGG
jgi:Undecaprenyl pyrophosphate synthase